MVLLVSRIRLELQMWVYMLSGGSMFMYFGWRLMEFVSSLVGNILLVIILWLL